VAFELVLKEEEKDSLIRTSSSNRWQVTVNNEQVTVNNDVVNELAFGLKVSDQLEFNRIKTIEDLKYIYPDIEFEIFQKTLEIMSAGGEFTTIKIPSLKSITSNMAQFVTEWLDSNPTTDAYVNKILFYDEAQAAALPIPGVFIFGEAVLVPGGKVIRSITDAKQIGDHELRHGFDNYIEHYETEDFSREEIESEGIQSKYRELAQRSMIKIRNDEELVKIANAMDHLVTKSGAHTLHKFETALKDTDEIPFLHGHFLKIYAEAPDTDEAFRAQQLAKQYVSRVRQLTGLYPYAFKGYERGEDRPKEYAEIPTVGSEREDPYLRLRIAQGDDVARDTVQMEYDAGVIPKEKYLYLMGEHCEGSNCGRCKYYSLTCLSRPEIVFYSE